MNVTEFLRALTSSEPPPAGLDCLGVRSVETEVRDALVAECARLTETESFSVAAAPSHPTRWTQPVGDVRQYSLLTGTGRCDDTSRDHDHSCFGKRFWQSDRYPILATVLESVPHCVNARLNWLGPGARLAAHREAILYRTIDETVGAKIRFHLPIRTSWEALLMVSGNWYHLEPGVFYLFNNGRVHAAVNGGADPRWHLVFDCLLTKEVFDELLGDRDFGGPLHLLPAQIPLVVRREPIVGVIDMPPNVDAALAGKLSLAVAQ